MVEIVRRVKHGDHIVVLSALARLGEAKSCKGWVTYVDHNIWWQEAPEGASQALSSFEQNRTHIQYTHHPSSFAISLARMLRKSLFDSLSGDHAAIGGCDCNNLLPMLFYKADELVLYALDTCG